MDTKAHHRVVITGGGVVSCLGLDQQGLRAAILQPHTGLQQIQMDPAVDCRTVAGGQVDRRAMQDRMQTEKIRYREFTTDAAALASTQALREAQVPVAPEQPRDMAVVVGSGASNVECNFATYRTFFLDGAKRVRPTTVPRGMNNAISAQLSIRHRCAGPNFVVSSACASSSSAMGQAFRMIRHGYWKQALCGGADTIFSPTMLTAWDRLGIMSRNPDPAHACRPFDRDRDGLVIGEGAAMLVLESLASARQRGAHIRAEICGYGESSDASHMTTPHAEGQKIAIQNALTDASVPSHELGWVHAHGTGTILNDQTECESLRQALGPDAAHIPVVSLKSYYGHMLGAAGAIDLLSSIIALEHGIVPAAINLSQPAPCTQGLQMAADTPQACDLPYCLKCGFGFGGSNAVFVLRRWQEE